METLIENIEDRLLTPEGAESVLEQMARVLTPADAELRQLVASVKSAEAEHLNDDGVVLDEAGEQLRRAQVRYRALVEQIPAVTFMAPLDGTVAELYVSPQIEQLLGFTAEEWLNNPILWYQQLHPDDKDRWQAEFARTLNAGEHFISEYRFLSRSNRVVWVHAEAKIVSDEQGLPLFLQGVAFDITQSKTAEEKLHQVNSQLLLARDQALEASRAKSAFLANMSHELRTPLNAIIGFSEMLTEEADEEGFGALLPDLQKIHGSAKHLLSLISGVLDLSKIEAGKMALFLETFDLAALIRDIASGVLPVIKKGGNTLEVDCPSDLGSIRADTVKVRQILLNLLSNAAKFTQDGTIVLQASRIRSAKGDQFRIDVTDNGIGIPPEALPHLFETFNQGDNSTTRKFGGTGLGLAISKRFSQLMGGNIEVHSEMGYGSIFSVHLPVEVVPVAEDSPPPSELIKTPAPPVPSVPEIALPDRCRILIIDDNAANREILRRTVSREGWTVVVADNGRTALQRVTEAVPDLILMDLLMPDMDGFEFARLLRKTQAGKSIPVVVVSAKQLSEDDRKVLNGSVQKVFQRGLYERDELKLEVHRLLATNSPPLTAGSSQRPATAVVSGDLSNALRLQLEQARAERDSALAQLTQHTVAATKAVQEAEQAARRKTVEAEAELAQRRKALEDEAEKAGRRKAMEAEAELAARRKAVEAEVEQAARRKAQETEAELAARRRALEAEAEQSRRQLREQQQSVELLRAECDDAWSQVNSLAKDKEQLEQQKVQRTGAPVAHRPVEPAPADGSGPWRALPSAGPRQRQVEEEVEQLRRQLFASQSLQQQAEAGLDAALVRLCESNLHVAPLREPNPHAASVQRSSLHVAPLREPNPQAASVQRSNLHVAPLREPNPHAASMHRSNLHVAALRDDAPVEMHQPPDRSAEPTSDQWFISYRDALGRVNRASCTTAEIRQWCDQGLLYDATEVLVARTANGPFEPLNSYAEFRRQPQRPLRTRSLTLNDIRLRVKEGLNWSVVIAITLGGGVVGGILGILGVLRK